MKPIVHRVGFANRLIEIIHRVEIDRWTEDLFVVNGGVSRHILKHRRFHQRPVAAATGQYRGTFFDRLGNPALDPSSLTLVDHRAHVGGFVHLVADRVALGSFDEELTEFVIDISVDVNPLHPDAVLSRRPKGAGNAGFCSPIDIGVVPHDHRRVRAELHADLFESSLGDDVLSGFDATGEADHAHPRVRHEGVSEHCSVAGKTLENTRRKTGLDKGLGQFQRRQWGHGRRLENHRVSAGNGRSEFVGNQVERIVEGGDRDHHSDRHPFEVTSPLFTTRKAVEGDGLAKQALGLLAGNGQGVDAAFRLAPGFPNRLRALTGDGDGEILEVVGHDRCGLEEDLRALVGAHRSGSAAGGVGRRERCLDVIGGGGRDGVDQGVVKRIPDVDCLFSIHPLAGQQHFHLSSPWRSRSGR